MGPFIIIVIIIFLLQYIQILYYLILDILFNTIITNTKKYFMYGDHFSDKTLGKL